MRPSAPPARMRPPPAATALITAPPGWAKDAGASWLPRASTSAPHVVTPGTAASAAAASSAASAESGAGDSSRLRSDLEGVRVLLGRNGLLLLPPYDTRDGEYHDEQHRKDDEEPGPASLSGGGPARGVEERSLGGADRQPAARSRFLKRPEGCSLKQVGGVAVVVGPLRRTCGEVIAKTGDLAVGVEPRTHHLPPGQEGVVNDLDDGLLAAGL